MVFQKDHYKLHFYYMCQCGAKAESSPNPREAKQNWQDGKMVEVEE